MDAIDRQAAIDAIDKYIAGFDAIDANFLDGLKTAKQLIKDLFSVIPEPSEDVISRQAAIDDLRDKDPSQIWDTADVEVWVNSLPSVQPDWNELMVICDCCGHAIQVKRVDAKPIIEPERKKGKWIYHDDDDMRFDTYHCSICRKQFTVDAERFDDIGFVKDDLKYCPNCGADMRGET